MISEIAKTRKYYPVCKKYAKRDFLADELHQEFLLRLCEIGEDKIKETYDGGYLDWFCLDVINKIWGKRTRVKCYDNGQTSPLYEFTSQSTDIEPSTFSPIYDLGIDVNYHLVKKEIEKDINSDDIATSYRSRVFTYSVGMDIIEGKIKEGGKYKNPRQFSKDVGIPYPSLIKAFNLYKKKLKDKFK